MAPMPNGERPGPDHSRTQAFCSRPPSAGGRGSLHRCGASRMKHGPTYGQLLPTSSRHPSRQPELSQLSPYTTAETLRRPVTPPHPRYTHTVFLVEMRLQLLHELRGAQLRLD